MSAQDEARAVLINRLLEKYAFSTGDAFHVLVKDIPALLADYDAERESKLAGRVPAVPLSVVRQEIEWHEAHKGDSRKDRKYEEGFLAGLKQIERLFAEETTVPVSADAACCFWEPGLELGGRIWAEVEPGMNRKRESNQKAKMGAVAGGDGPVTRLAPNTAQEPAKLPSPALPVQEREPSVAGCDHPKECGFCVSRIPTQKRDLEKEAREIVAIVANESQGISGFWECAVKPVAAYLREREK